MSFHRRIDRRDFIRGVGALGATAAGLPAQAAATPFSFLHGVASGDPLADRVVIWTRVTPQQDAPVPVTWEIALDDAFRRVLRRGRVLTNSGRDFTVKVDVLGLPSGATLFYRFSAGAAESPVGRTRTLPVGHVEQLKLAVFSCSNYPAGYFHAYGEAAKLDDLFASVHLGDYIYEYPRGGYASDTAAAMGREVEPASEIVSLADYRQRYAQYRSDPDLQTLHARMPMIAVWDDHEIANDTWKDGAENHDPATEGLFSLRKAAAVRAYHEWMPTRPVDASRPDRIYRSFAFGNLIALHMLDTRVIGRDRQLSYTDYFGVGGFDAAAFQAALTQPARQLLGAEQSGWLNAQVAGSTATWQVLGQQVLMGRMNIPAPLVLAQISFSNYVALLQKAATHPELLTAPEQAILAQPAIPYNLDAWDGYFMARENVLGLMRALNRNLVVLSGDTHNAWANDLADYAGNAVGVEFATPGVSSPGLEEYFPLENPVAVAAGLTQIIGPLQYANTHQRGFMVVTANHAECSAKWFYVSTVKSTGYFPIEGPAFKTLPGPANRKLIPV
ncbi:MAG: alkaline phosphatase D family protein [Betaproteobacteria bacterium]|nr:alkaline phosphatase D family protein [Betaproteobacteria bacterium]